MGPCDVGGSSHSCFPSLTFRRLQRGIEGTDLKWQLWRCCAARRSQPASSCPVFLLQLPGASLAASLCSLWIQRWASKAPFAEWAVVTEAVMVQRFAGIQQAVPLIAAGIPKLKASSAWLAAGKGWCLVCLQAGLLGQNHLKGLRYEVASGNPRGYMGTDEVKRHADFTRSPLCQVLSSEEIIQLPVFLL